VAAECANLQKQVDVLQSVEQSQNVMAEWLQPSLQQLSEAVSTPPYTAQLRRIIDSYQVCVFYCTMCLYSTQQIISCRQSVTC